MTGQRALRRRRIQLLALLFAALYVVGVDANVCRGCAGEDDNWYCAEVTLDCIRHFCGFGNGGAVCIGSAWRVECYDDPPWTYYFYWGSTCS